MEEAFVNYYILVKIMYMCRVSFRFLPKGDPNEIVWIIGGQVRICVQSMWQTRRVRGHALPGNFDFGLLLLDAIWWNLGLFLHKNLLCH